jgi:protein-disulfide isomerase
MRTLVRGLVATVCLLVALPAAAQEQSSPFTPEERAALHAEIRSYLLANPDLLMEMVGLLEEKKQASAAETEKSMLSTQAEAIFDDGFSHVAGNPDASVTMVAFLDYQCGYCRRASPEVQALLDGDDDLKMVVKELPILGPGSELAARAAIATLMTQGGEAYMQLHEALLGLKGEVTEVSLDRALAEAGLDAPAIHAAMDDPEVTRRLEATRALAEQLGIAGTPTFVLEDRFVRGYVPLDALETIVAEVRAAG